MFRLFKKNTINKESSLNEEPKQAEKPSFFSRLKQSLGKTRDSFTSKLSSLFQGKNSLDEETLEELEAILIQADIGFDLSERFISNLKKDKAIAKDPNLAIDNLKNQLEAILAPVEKPLHLNSTNTPFVILMVGINGAGKTTSIAKLSKMFKAQGKSVLLAAGDTFRAAAVEQLQAWGQQEGVPVISQHQGADSASVIFDAYNSAKSKNIDILIADTAGRLHTQNHLMRELEKISKVLKKIDPQAPHETLLVLDAGTGQNAIKQVSAFNDIINVSGLCIT
ncbi:MAG: signal recognition particle-docking protein FtsY, partial [Francisellaceae bacterium]|nr:signal recognition particle-docking protein FtsY [Francisellaceae bacterium]